MARAFGDFCLKDFGLISIPDVYYHHITVGDEFVILASVGVWDVLSNMEAVEIVTSAPDYGTEITTTESSEIVSVVEEVKEKLLDRSLGLFNRSLAEFLATADDE
ncbi:unnamed protein product [Fraxinus pennsylvanica]|uniref:PPM-type phosphatase domain-containing protein n=1 Tax=Fraxinus pennsylvanica TaxID=56036 RepID=A0AAD2DMG9_9LAMI|nr:unnamed protein product [Fraxinus pennsylvanica]